MKIHEAQKKKERGQKKKKKKKKKKKNKGETSYDGSEREDVDGKPEDCPFFLEGETERNLSLDYVITGQVMAFLNRVSVPESTDFGLSLARLLG